MSTRLPIVAPSGSLRNDGSRAFIHPADVRGRFTRRRRGIFILLILVYLVLPFVHVGGHPAVFLDVPGRRFHLFGSMFNAQDFWLVFFLVTGVGFGLVVLTTLFGRVFCGYACPQTVLLEGLYRRVERLIEGPRQTRMKRDRGRLGVDKLCRKLAKHGAFLVISLFLAHFFLSYFVSLPSLVQMVQSRPTDHPAAFGWIAGMSAALYLDFAWLREQVCIVLCPYGRLQSTLTDSDTLIIGYEDARGEPRGKPSTHGAGDCVDCRRCVHVCPTGIDIREGLQLECIGCAACVDACDGVMQKLGRPPGLIRYDSKNGFEGKTRRTLRPRLSLYIVLGAVGLAAVLWAFSTRTHYEANVLRVSGAPYAVDGERVRNALEVHLVNKYRENTLFRLDPSEAGALEYVLPLKEIRLSPLQGSRAPFFVSARRGTTDSESIIQIRIVPEGRPGEHRMVQAPFLAPPR